MWETVKLGDVVNISIGKTPSRSENLSFLIHRWHRFSQIFGHHRNTRKKQIGFREIPWCLRHFCGLCTMQQITKVLAAEPSVKKAIIYGSRAKGTHKAFSDIDVMLNKMPLRDFLALNARLNELPIPYKIDLVLENHMEAPELQAHIARVGQIFYERKDVP